MRDDAMAPELKNALAPKTLDLPFEVKLGLVDDDDAADGTIEGYASVFGLLDRGGDIVEPGAFKRSLTAWRRKKQLPPMLWYHDPSRPIGAWKAIEEDDKGLKVRGELNLDVQAGKEVHALLKQDAISGLSIGYSTRDENTDRQTGARHLLKVDLWEISLVTIPMLEEAQIDAVKGLKDFNPRELEGGLRDAGLSRSDAKKAVGVFRTMFQSDAGETGAPLRDDARDCLMTLRKAAALVRN